MQYSDFANGRIEINKNKMKIKKALEYFYTDPRNAVSLKRDFPSVKARKRINLNDPNKDTCLYLHFNHHFPVKDDNENHNFLWHREVNSEDVVHKYSQQNKIIINNKLLRSILRHIDEILYEINCKKLPFDMKGEKKKFEVVISANFADWFLASTGENWHSCISLESTFSQSYWFGNPGMITDRNRAIIYITDGVEKEYHGIVVDRILARSFIHIARNDLSKKLCYFINHGYPNSHHNLYETILKQWCTAKNMDSFNGYYRSCKIPYTMKYSVPFLWHRIENNDNRDYPNVININCATYIDNGFSFIIDDDNYGIINHYDEKLNNEGGVNYYMKLNEESIREIKHGRFNWTRGLSYLDAEHYTAAQVYRFSGYD